MAEANDWRLSGQERFLTGVALCWTDWHRPRPGWDHDHCAFCWAKFAEEPGPDLLGAGYATADRSYWVCPQCFADFRERFGWVVVGEARPAEQNAAADRRGMR
jgi:hypothetical protein